jgi:leader peptidase (prepilin peptidase) / N-methyltransferase
MLALALPLLAAPGVGWLLARLIQRLAQQLPSCLAVGAAACGVAAWALLSGQAPDEIWITCLLGWTLLALGWIDALCLRLPDVLTLPLLLGGLGVAAMDGADQASWHAVAAACGYLGLRGIALAYRTLRGREGLGAGDAKLLAAAGAWLGLAALPWLLLLAAISALVWVLAAAVAGRSLHAGTEVAFGPFLAAAFWLLWLYG